MPKNKIDYSNCKIYKICCKDPQITYEYYGHTTNEIERKRLHKNKCNNPNSKAYNCKLYQTIRENGGFENWNMIIIENYECNNVNEAKLRERYWIELRQSQLNSYIPLRTIDEYYKSNKEEYTERNKQYYNENKEHIKQKSRERWELNKESMNEKREEYRKKKINCECGGKYTIAGKKYHFGTIKHSFWEKKNISLLHDELL